MALCISSVEKIELRRPTEDDHMTSASTFQLSFEHLLWADRRVVFETPRHIPPAPLFVVALSAQAPAGDRLQEHRPR